MTSATDELRRLLDERGVEWRVGDYPTTCTVWESGGIVWYSLWRDGCIELMAWQVTPEQAIDATLGRGTCHDMYTDDDEWFACSECNTELRVHEPFGVICSIRYCPNCGRKVKED